AHSVRSEGGWLAAGWVLGRPGADRPSPWPGSAPGRPKQPAFSRCIGLAVRGREAPVGHGYKNVKGQGTVTTPWRDRQVGAVNVFLRIPSTVTAIIGPGSYEIRPPIRSGRTTSPSMVEA